MTKGAEVTKVSIPVILAPSQNMGRLGLNMLESGPKSDGIALLRESDILAGIALLSKSDKPLS